MVVNIGYGRWSIGAHWMDKPAMRVNMRMNIAVGILGVLICTFSGISGAGAAVDPATDFLYIDCGATGASADEFGITWQPDDAYVSTGAVAKLTDTDGVWTEFQTLRYFKDASRAKHCYTLPVTPGKTYMLRAGFFHGSYDNSGAPYPSFQLALDSSIVEDVKIPRARANTVRELTFEAKHTNVTSLCLIQDATRSTPFISSISLRAVDVLPPTILSLLAENQTVTTRTRFYLNNTGGVIVYNKGLWGADAFDRYWFRTNGSNTNGYPLTTASVLSTTSPLEGLTTVNNISTDLLGAHLSYTPATAIQGALTTSGSLTIDLDTSVAYNAFVQYYFVELDETVNVTDRSFYIEALGSKPFLQNVLNSTGGRPFTLMVASQKSALIEKGSKIYMYPDPLRTNPFKGPMLSALEVYRINISRVPPTNYRDWTAVEIIKVDMKLTSWRGDPCLPHPHEWLTCSAVGFNADAEILSIVLSGTNLTGGISPGFGDLRSLTSLKLDENSLTGPFPDLKNLKNLKTLHLQNNNLTGPLPEWLASLPGLQELFVQNNNFSGDIPAQFSNKRWKFDYSGNPLLNAAPPSPPSKKSNVGIIAGAAAGGLVALALVVGLIVYFVCCRRRSSNKNVEEPSGVTPVPGVPRNEGNTQFQVSHVPKMLDINARGGAREYSIAEVVAATGNYRNEIGKGSFGPVYYGKFPDGKEVAVKVLDVTSQQGESEFFNEVDILSRVHHKYIVSLVGYCRAPKKQMLIYEYIHRGSLRDHLDNDSSKSGLDILGWKSRLNIALHAALGLEYLHTGCNPNLIHRDVKSSNILITSKYDAKVADFGLSKLVGEGDATRVLTIVKGTAGYMDPEYYSTQLLSAKSDVYSFGVVLLELITGRLPIDRTIPNEIYPNICDWVRSTLEQGSIDAILDPSLRASHPNYDALWKVAEIALQSVEPKSVHRPTMSEVVQELNGAVALEASGSFSSSRDPPPHHTRMPSEYSDYSSTTHYNPESYPIAR